MQYKLCDVTLPTVNIKITVDLDYSYFEITGIDTGDAPKDAFGQDEYCYMYTIDNQTDLNHFYESLGTEKNLEKIGEKVMILFGGIDGCKCFRNFCEDNKIPYLFKCF